MNRPEISRLFFSELLKLHKDPVADYPTKFQELNALLIKLLNAYTDNENLHFTTTYARIAFIAYKYNLSTALQWRIHAMRRNFKNLRSGHFKAEEKEFITALKTFSYTLASLGQIPVPTELKNIFSEWVENEVEKYKPRYKDKIDSLKVITLDIDEQQELLICSEYGVDNPQLLRVKYNEMVVNQHFNDTIQKIKTVFNLKAVLNLVEVLVDESGIYIPKVIVLEPDYLVDVTSIAECFTDFGSSSLVYLMNKLKSKDNSKALTIGNIANFLLDELMTNPDIAFTEIKPKLFQTNPMAFIEFDNDGVKEIVEQAQKHFSSLKKVTGQDFEQVNISPDDCYLEPSFYSQKYGLQGRLDVWNKPSGTNKAAIVELKSGAPFKPNIHGLSHNHFAQTTLYDLLVQSVYPELDIITYILYSKLDVNHLKLSPSERFMKDEVIRLRNEIVALDRQLASMDLNGLEQATILDKVSAQSVPKASGFFATELKNFEKIRKEISELERRYMLAFIAFTSREQLLTKTGAEDSDKNNGQASLWLSDFDEKNINFQVLSDLKISEVQNEKDQTLIILNRTEQTHPLANFRQGDIGVLYPRQLETDTVMQHQIFKGSIIEINNDAVHFRLNSRQFNETIFQNFEKWTIEPDMMDKSYNTQMAGLFDFLKTKKDFRNLILTLRAPVQSSIPTIEFENKNLNEIQKNVLNAALSSNDYFLLLGPPGTGKTKFMLAEMVRHLLKNTDEQIILLAYTNRAVDEICEAIHDFAENDYLRMGSKYSSDERFEGRMFSVLSEKVNNRKDLLDIISGHRIVISTVATLLSRPQILKHKNFSTAIIDEASQILEPMMVGILPHFKRFILIGDHKQLPAVVLQDRASSAVQDEKLLEIGLYNRRNSLFERLYNRAVQNDWHWAWRMLSNQGRMHSDIAEFPSENYYAGKLNLLNDESGAWQQEPLNYILPDNASPLMTKLASKRVIFIPSEPDNDGNPKTNLDEATKVAMVTDAFRQLYQFNNQEFDSKMIGVITPFRAQIAQIKKELEALEQNFENCTIDTVERYQGGAREIIIISLCINSFYQLESVVSMSDDNQVDRKLNVALTRARKHLVIIANQNLMQNVSHYNQLLDWIKSNEGFCVM
jgi:DNA replication ATP-dependent helicase Dna2